MRATTLLLFVFCFVACSWAAPVSDTEAAFRILNKYLQRFNNDDLQELYYGADHGSIKRGLGPRPLRFG